MADYVDLGRPWWLSSGGRCAVRSPETKWQSRGLARRQPDDRSTARALLEEMAQRIADPELRAVFEADSKTLNLQSTHAG